MRLDETFALYAYSVVPLYVRESRGSSPTQPTVHGVTSLQGKLQSRAFWLIFHGYWNPAESFCDVGNFPSVIVNSDAAVSRRYDPRKDSKTLRTYYAHTIVLYGMWYIR